jgi:hypothetical protein
MWHNVSAFNTAAPGGALRTGLEERSTGEKALFLGAKIFAILSLVKGGIFRSKQHRADCSPALSFFNPAQFNV